jgi:hypothetical protein
METFGVFLLFARYGIFPGDFHEASSSLIKASNLRPVSLSDLVQVLP